MNSFLACEHDLGYFEWDYLCLECGGHRTAVKRDVNGLAATVNGEAVIVAEESGNE